MSQRKFIATVIVVNVLFIILQFDKRLRSKDYTHYKQTLEQKLALAVKKREQLETELHHLQHHTNVQHYVAHYLGMQPNSAKQIKHLPA